MPDCGQEGARGHVKDASLQAFEAGGVRGTGALEGPPSHTIEATAVQADPAPTNMKKVVGSGIGAQGGPPTENIPASQLPRPPEKERSDGYAGGAPIVVSDSGNANRDTEVIGQDTLPRPPEFVETDGAPFVKAATLLLIACFVSASVSPACPSASPHLHVLSSACSFYHVRVR